MMLLAVERVLAYFIRSRRRSPQEGAEPGFRALRVASTERVSPTPHVRAYSTAGTQGEDSLLGLKCSSRKV
jgi:hypothetical protein